MIHVRYLRPAKDLDTCGVLPESVAAAHFETGDGREVRVRLGRVCPYRDVQLALYAPSLRRRWVDALCSAVREAVWEDEEQGWIDLVARDRVSPDRDAVSWTVAGFNNLRRVHLKVVKHVLCQGERDRERAYQAVAAALGLELRLSSYLNALDNVGCVNWRELHRDPPPLSLNLHRGLTARQRSAVARILAEPRERFLEHVRRALRERGRFDRARHVHAYRGEMPSLHVLGDDGLLVIADGQADAMPCRTAYFVDGTHAGELTPEGLRSARRSVFRKAARCGREARIHTPDRWREIR